MRINDLTQGEVLMFFFEGTLSRVPYNAMYVRRPNEDELQSLLYRSHAVQVVRTRNRCKRNVFLLLGLYVTVYTHCFGNEFE